MRFVVNFSLGDALAVAIDPRWKKKKSTVAHNIEFLTKKLYGT